MLSDNGAFQLGQPLSPSSWSFEGSWLVSSLLNWMCFSSESKQYIPWILDSFLQFLVNIDWTVALIEGDTPSDLGPLCDAFPTEIHTLYHHPSLKIHWKNCSKLTILSVLSIENFSPFIQSYKHLFCYLSWFFCNFQHSVIEYLCQISEDKRKYLMSEI